MVFFENLKKQKGHSWTSSTWVAWKGFLRKCSHIHKRIHKMLYWRRSAPRKLKVLWCFFAPEYISFNKDSEAIRDKIIWQYLLRKASKCIRAPGVVSLERYPAPSRPDKISAPSQNLYNTFPLLQQLTWHNKVSAKPIEILVLPAPTLGP